MGVSREWARGSDDGSPERMNKMKAYKMVKNVNGELKEIIGVYKSGREMKKENPDTLYYKDATEEILDMAKLVNKIEEIVSSHFMEHPEYASQFMAEFFPKSDK